MRRRVKRQAMTEQSRQPHIRLQGRYFDKRAEVFLKPIPESIQERTRMIVEAAGLDESSFVLDVGCGVGVLICHFLECGVPAPNIVGCDLSEEMLKRAKARYPGVFYWQGDIVDLPSPLPESFPEQIKLFDVVFFNACFGNMFDQKETISAAIRLLTKGGRIVLSHPMGASFVEKLHDNEPEIVPHLLPPEPLLESWAGQLGFTLELFEDKPLLYLAILRV